MTWIQSSLKILNEKKDRAGLGQILSRCESSVLQHRREIADLLQNLQTQGKTQDSFRIAITGLPGAGKSSLIESLGLKLIEQGHRVGVLAIDPSSPETGGSILGDKTRMNQLSQNPNAFIRPSASSGHLGGVARSTREQIQILEAAGYDRILVETVGVGQNETQVASMVDCSVLVLIPGAGDDLQGIKRGILEISDLLVVNKADAANRSAAERTLADYRMAFSVRSEPSLVKRKLFLTSVIENTGISELIAGLEAWKIEALVAGTFEERRKRTRRAAFFEAANEMLLAAIHEEPAFQSPYESAMKAVESGALTPQKAAQTWVDGVLARCKFKHRNGSNH